MPVKVDDFHAIIDLRVFSGRSFCDNDQISCNPLRTKPFLGIGPPVCRMLRIIHRKDTIRKLEMLAGAFLAADSC